MVLTQLAIVKATTKGKPYKLSDGGGLHLLIRPTGSKLWRFRYRFAGVERMLALGSFPAVSLATARGRQAGSTSASSAVTMPRRCVWTKFER